MTSTCHFCQILIELEFSGQIFEKFSNITFYEDTSSASWVPWGRAGGDM